MNFGKDGSVKPALAKLPTIRTQQEVGAIERFIERYNEVYPSSLIAGLVQLPQDDHDFLVTVGGVQTEIQLTELVDRDFVLRMTDEEYHSGKWDRAVVKAQGELPWKIDVEAMNQALTNSVALKVKKNYSASGSVPLWLVVFSTFPYETESSVAGAPHLSEGLCRARRYLAEIHEPCFTEVWFTDLQTKPVRVWPCSSDAMKSTPNPAPPAGKRVQSIMILPTAMWIGRTPSRR
jgi:hypothetical protein